MSLLHAHRFAGTLGQPFAGDAVYSNLAGTVPTLVNAGDGETGLQFAGGAQGLVVAAVPSTTGRLVYDVVVEFAAASTAPVEIVQLRGAAKVASLNRTSDGRLQLSNAAASGTGLASTVAQAPVGTKFRVVLDANNGSGNYVATIYATDDPGATVLATLTVPQAATAITSVRLGYSGTGGTGTYRASWPILATTPGEVGARNYGGTTTPPPAAGYLLDWSFAGTNGAEFTSDARFTHLAGAKPTIVRAVEAKGLRFVGGAEGIVEHLFDPAPDPAVSLKVDTIWRLSERVTATAVVGQLRAGAARGPEFAFTDTNQLRLIRLSGTTAVPVATTDVELPVGDLFRVQLVEDDATLTLHLFADDTSTDPIATLTSTSSTPIAATALRLGVITKTGIGAALVDVFRPRAATAVTPGPPTYPALPAEPPQVRAVAPSPAEPWSEVVLVATPIAGSSPIASTVWTPGAGSPPLKVGTGAERRLVARAAMRTKTYRYTATTTAADGQTATAPVDVVVLPATVGIPQVGAVLVDDDLVTPVREAIADQPATDVLSPPETVSVTTTAWTGTTTVAPPGRVATVTVATRPNVADYPAATELYGLSDFSYAGTWSSSATERFSATVGRQALLSVDVPQQGGRVTLHGHTPGPNRGIAALAIDGVAAGEVSTYGPGTYGEDQPWWTSPFLAAGRHTITVTVTGRKEAASTGTFVSLTGASLTTPEVRADLVEHPPVTGSGTLALAAAGLAEGTEYEVIVSTPTSRVSSAFRTVPVVNEPPITITPDPPTKLAAAAGMQQVTFTTEDGLVTSRTTQHRVKGTTPWLPEAPVAAERSGFQTATFGASNNGGPLTPGTTYEGLLELKAPGRGKLTRVVEFTTASATETDAPVAPPATVTVTPVQGGGYADWSTVSAVNFGRYEYQVGTGPTTAIVWGDTQSTGAESDEVITGQPAELRHFRVRVVTAKGLAGDWSAVRSWTPAQVEQSTGKLLWALPDDWGQTSTGPAEIVPAASQLTFSRPGDYEIQFPRGRTFDSTFQVNVDVNAPAGIRVAITKGGHIKTPTVSAKPVIFNCQGVSFLHVQGLRLSGPGTAFDQLNKEGIRGDTRRFGVIVQLQDILIDQIVGTQAGAHSDLVQWWSGPAIFRVDRVQGKSNFQGYIVHPRQFGPWGANPTQLKDYYFSNIWVDSDYDLKTPFYSWHDLTTKRPFIHTRDLFVTCGPGQTPDRSIASTGEGNPRIDPNPWNVYTVGVRPPGGTVLLGQPGHSYVSPGYMTNAQALATFPAPAVRA